ncbi:MAG TPA: prenyltransferase/squalene oxidase repeat-containing protein, partial [Kofleriaceae bacterium]|nr:prenyltransferase/squalene oxidase repeat-containing protein [Kofleriaceae bacterium]
PTLAIAGLLPREKLPEPHLLIQLLPFLQSTLGRRFNQWTGMSARIMPLITRGLVDGRRASWLTHPVRRAAEDRILEFLGQVQNPTGSLSGVLIYTAQLVSALVLMQVPQNDPRLSAALDALASFRIPNAAGMEYMPCTAEIWNTAVAVRTTLRAGGDARTPAIDAAIAWLISHQTTIDAPRSWQNPRPGAPRQGGWPFEATNVRNPDCDTTAAVLSALGWVIKRGERGDVRCALERGLQWLLPMQNADGGWPSMTRGLGEKPPGPMFTEPFSPPTTPAEMLGLAIHPPLELQDPSTAAMTGRIVRALADCGIAKDAPALSAARDFLRAQQWHHRWWGRWEVNWIAGTAYGLIGAAGTSADLSSDWITRAAAWIASRQNPDGGFGERTETYRDWQAGGPWPSRADLTGKVLMALVEVRGPNDDTVQRAADYLLSTQREDGTWRTDDGEYVILPPDLFYTNPLCNQIDATEGLIWYREAMS